MQRAQDPVGLESIMANLENSSDKEELTLSPENLHFHSGDTAFLRDEFIRVVSPYFKNLKQVNRTNFLCAFVYGNDEKADVTGYRSDKTINVTNNTRIIKANETGGHWVVYELKS